MPQALCVAYVTLAWATREAEVLLMLVGQTGCEALNFIMKRIIKEERPKRTWFHGETYILCLIGLKEENTNCRRFV